ncbi:hypothetical protein [Vibrio penaeicida]|uniref:Uncharacterized protein n=1 Tax=Vibrio penaeicida TaxID=104609 RepID=A0AAV5NMI4_9VIBR|nr:hypothetical protein [Vibrio penaeicida]RTZ21059.1 hypothetical protein EKN09_21270 [Vibrio penaeicida]GLQ71690.1 hypothetical protein GCM10007932_10500 [Vibrio penaeicida]
MINKFKVLMAASASILLAGCTSDTTTSHNAGYPEPPSWDFPYVTEAAYEISPHNLEGRPFNSDGLAYTHEELEALPVKNMTSEQLQNYADVVTHAFPDATYQSVPESCEDISAESLNETSLANVAYISIQAVEKATRDSARSCLATLQKMYRKE